VRKLTGDRVDWGTGMPVFRQFAFQNESPTRGSKAREEQVLSDEEAVYTASTYR
jgi:hypothetical protein